MSNLGINLANATIDERPLLGVVQIRVSVEAQVKALLKGETLQKDWKIEIRSAEAAKLALNLGGALQADGSVELDAREVALDPLPDLRDATEALLAVQAKKGGKPSDPLKALLIDRGELLGRRHRDRDGRSRRLRSVRRRERPRLELELLPGVAGLQSH